MIDINAVLRRAAETGKMPPKPKMTVDQIVAAAAEMLRTASPHDPYRERSDDVVDLSRRPDGVWELPK